MDAKHRRRKRPTTTASYAGMLRRTISRYAYRVGEDPAEGLAALADIRRDLEEATSLGLYLASLTADSDGNRWTPGRLGNAVGLTRQAVMKRITQGEAIARSRSRQQRGRAAVTVAAPRQLESGPGQGQAQDSASSASD